MWKRFPNNSSFFMFFIQNDDYKILITDYLTLWFVRLPENDFISRLKESNTTLEINNSFLKSNGIHMLSHPDKLRKADIKVEGQTMQVSMSMSFGYPFKLSLSLKEGSKEMFFKKVTQPLLKLVQNLKSSENELRNLLKKKDSEIEEYKSEGAQVARHFKTSKFNDEQHMIQFRAYAESYGSSEIPKDILEKSITLPEDTVVKAEPVCIKPETREPPVKMKSEPETPAVSVKSEPETPPVSVKSEAETPTVSMKSEPETPSVVENHRIQATVSVKRESIETRPGSVTHDPRKRMRARLNL